MATKIIHNHTCDDCERDHLYDVVAEQHYVIAINDGPYKRFDFCSPSERAVMGRILQLYREGGEDLEQAQQASHGAELPAAPEEKRATEATPPAPAAKKRRTGKSAKALPSKEAKPPLEGPPLQVWCTQRHGDGAGKLVAYRQRGMHADKVHGLNVWEIKWKDPHEILKVPCTAHAECMEAGLSFTNAGAAATHAYKCPLPRIDGGASQTIDEAAREQPGGS